MALPRLPRPPPSPPAAAGVLHAPLGFYPRPYNLKTLSPKPYTPPLPPPPQLQQASSALHQGFTLTPQTLPPRLQLQQTSSVLRQAVDKLVTYDMSGWEWPADTSLAVYRSLLRQTLSNLAEAWRSHELMLELPRLPVVGRLQLSAETVLQVSLTSAAACSMNLLAMVGASHDP